MKIKLLVFFYLSVFSFRAYAQEDSTLFERLQAIANGGVEFFNVDGIEITSQALNGELSKKNISKKFRKYSIKEADLNQSDSTLGMPNYYVFKTEHTAPDLTNNTSYYFITTPDGMKAVTFGSINKTNRAFERYFLKLLINNEIPRSVYASLNVDSINFAGRKLPLGSSCRWMGVNNIQCPYYGQMNWNVHSTLQDALASATNQYKTIQVKKQGKVVAEEEVDVVFEGTDVKARRIVYDFKGVTSLLAGMSGGKTLTVYYVAAPVRQHFVSCAMSFWNNDAINPSGLPPLLEKVMVLKK